MPNKFFPDEPFSSANLPHNFENPAGRPIGPAEYFLNYSGLKGKNLEAALESCGLEPIIENGEIIGARSKQQFKANPRKIVSQVPGSIDVLYDDGTMGYGLGGGNAGITTTCAFIPSPWNHNHGTLPPPKSKQPDVAPLDFDLKRKIELEET